MYPVVHKIQYRSQGHNKVTYSSFLHSCLVSFRSLQNSQSMRMPLPSRVLRILPTEMSWCRILAFVTASKRADDNCQKLVPVEQKRPTNQSACDCIDQLSGGSEICQSAADRIEDELVVHVVPNGLARCSSLNFGVVAFMSWTVNA